MEFDDLEGQMETKHAVITVNTFEFSDEGIHSPGTDFKTEYFGLEERGPQYSMYELKVFTNGRTAIDEGYVSVTIDYTLACFLIRGRCIISVIDKYGNQKFTKILSFFKEDLFNGYSTYYYRPSTSFHIDRYICREKLLNNPDDLLPNDVLTLLIEVDFVEFKYKAPQLPSSYKDVFKSCFQYDEAGQPTKLLLDSLLAERLAKESIVFQSMLENEMEEKRTKTMDFDKNDYIAFKHIGEILMDEMTLIFKSITDIFDTYIVADRCLIPAVKETCSTFLKLCLSDHTVDEYFEIANEYEAQGLKELLVNVINLVKQTDFEAEIKKLKDVAMLKSPIRRCLWQYSHHDKDFPLVFQNVIEPPYIFRGKETFDFYK